MTPAVASSASQAKPPSDEAAPRILKRVKKRRIIIISSVLAVIAIILATVLGLYFSGGQARYELTVRMQRFFVDTFVEARLDSITEAECTPSGWSDVTALYADIRQIDANNARPSYEGTIEAAQADYNEGVVYLYSTPSSQFKPGSGVFARWKARVNVYVTNNKVDRVEFAG